MEDFDKLPWMDKGKDSKIYQHSFYDVDFDDDPTDLLYCFLHNINPEILEQELKAEAGPCKPEFVYVDPRTEKEALDEVIDYSKVGTAAKFFDKYPKKSLMTPSQHKVTIKYLQNQEKGGVSLNKTDLATYHKSEAKRSLERTTFHEFLKEYCLIYFPEIYKPLGEYMDIYRKGFTFISKDVLSKEDELFSIVTGFPLPQNISGFEANFKDIEVTRKEGATRLYCETIDLQPLAWQKEKYFGLSREEDSILESREGTIVMPEDALIFLLAADSGLESPSELIFEVEDNQSVVFKKPIPSRSISLRTPRGVFQNILDTYHAIPGKCELVNMTMDGIFPQKLTIEEIHSEIEEIPYNLELVDKFLQPVPSELTAKLSNQVEINFKLEGFQITLQRNVPFCFNEGNQTLLNFSPKLEYKSPFGCEVMSKFELLSEWVAQKFLPNSLTCRQRLDVKTFQKLHSSLLSINDIEEELEFRYKIQISSLLGSLHNLLELISKLSQGKYLLRHSEKAHDKFMVYKKTEGLDPENKGVISLHKIFQEEISSFEFFKHKKFVGIDHKVCSTVHLSSNAAPCAFPFWIKHGTTKPIKNDRTFLLKVEKKKAEAKEAKIKANRKKKKSIKSKEKRAKRKDQQKEEHEVDQDIQNDIKLGVC